MAIYEVVGWSSKSSAATDACLLCKSWEATARTSRFVLSKEDATHCCPGPLARYMGCGACKALTCMGRTFATTLEQHFSGIPTLPLARARVAATKTCRKRHHEAADAVSRGVLAKTMGWIDCWCEAISCWLIIFSAVVLLPFMFFRSLRGHFSIWQDGGRDAKLHFHLSEIPLVLQTGCDRQHGWMDIYVYVYMYKNTCTYIYVCIKAEGPYYMWHVHIHVNMWQRDINVHDFTS